MPYKKCKVCGKKFYVRPKDILSKVRGKYCSRYCYLKDKESKLVHLKCANCGKEIIRPKWRVNTKPMEHYFCSSKCYGEFKSKYPEKYPLYYRKYYLKVAKLLTENVLRKEYLDNKLRIKDIASKYQCSYSIVSARMRKYNIKTDRTRYSQGNSEDYWRRYLRKKYKGCQVCGWDKDVCDVAHIKARRDGGEYRESNLLYLCPNCHRLYDKGKLKI